VDTFRAAADTNPGAHETASSCAAAAHDRRPAREVALRSAWNRYLRGSMSTSPLGNGRSDRLDFGALSLDPRSGELWRNGAPVGIAALPSRLRR